MQVKACVGLIACGGLRGVAYENALYDAALHNNHHNLIFIIPFSLYRADGRAELDVNVRQPSNQTNRAFLVVHRGIHGRRSTVV